MAVDSDTLINPPASRPGIITAIITVIVAGGVFCILNWKLVQSWMN